MIIRITRAAASPIPAFPKEERATHNHLKHSKKEHPPLEKGYYCEGLQLPYRTKGNGRITQKDLQFFRASPYAPEWSGNIHESKLSDIHRPTQSRLPIGRLKNHKYKKSAYGGKKTAACGGYCTNSVRGFFVPRGGQRGAPYIYNKVEWGGWGYRRGCRPPLVDAARGWQ